MHNIRNISHFKVLCCATSASVFRDICDNVLVCCWIILASLSGQRSEVELKPRDCALFVFAITRTAQRSALQHNCNTNYRKPHPPSIMPPLHTRKSLEAMKRVDLQRLCKVRSFRIVQWLSSSQAKGYGVKANLKTEDLIDLLLSSQ